MEVDLLGPLRVTQQDTRIEVDAPMQRALLAVLAVHAGEVVSNDRLLDALWGDDQPAGGVKTLRYHVSKLRDALSDGREAVVTTPPGYMLVNDVETDVRRFRAWITQARTSVATDPAAASELVGRALALWRGPPLAEFEYANFAQIQIARFEEERLAAMEMKFEADLALGRHVEVIPELSTVTQQHAYRETLRGLLITALYRAGRQSDALREYQQMRTLLGEELGITPSLELMALERQVLEHDERLEAPPAHAFAREVRHNLPVPVSEFMGRAAELEAIEDLLAESRLVTLTGPGGAGKTRLALEVARRRTDGRHRDGVWLVDLSGTRVPALVPAVIADTIGVQLLSGSDEIQALARALETQSALLVIDNFEQVIDAAPVVTALLQAAPELHVLATSRERLRLSGERQYTVPSLDEDEAIALFSRHARSVRPDFDHDGDERHTIGVICETVDRLPLAIELAAARVDMLGTATLLDRLSSMLATLTHGSRDRPERHHTLRRTIEWSFDLLTPSEQRLFASLGAFWGGQSLEAVDRVCGPDVEIDVLDGLQALVEKSLVRAGLESDGTRRFFLLETLHEYARDQLERLLDPRELRARHCDYFVQLAGRIAPRLQEADPDAALASLKVELVNIREAITWAFTHGDPQQGALLIGSLREHYWVNEGLLAVPEAWAQELRDISDTLPANPQAEVRLVLGTMESWGGHYARAEETFRTALDDAPTSLDALLEADLTRSLALARVRVDPDCYDAAAALCREAIEQLEAIDAAPGYVSTAWMHLGLIACVGNDLSLARDAFQQQRIISERAGRLRDLIIAQCNLAAVADEDGEADESLRLVRMSLAAAWALDEHRFLTATLLHIVACAHITEGEQRRGVTLLAAAELAFQRAGMLNPNGEPIGSVEENRRAHHRLAGQLSPAELNRLTARGQSLTLDEAVATALG